MDGFITPEHGAMSGTVLEVMCINNHRDKSRLICSKSVLQCNNGNWEGIVPNCVKVNSCNPPPTIANGMISDFSVPKIAENEEFPVFPIGSKIRYKCLHGYIMIGVESFTCNSFGCWEPHTNPICKTVFDYNKSNLITPIITGIILMLILVIICIVIVSKRHKIFQRTTVSNTRMFNQLSDRHHRPLLPTINSATNLIQNPDRLALIAFADGIHVGQSILPTYEEAINGIPPRQNTLIDSGDYYYRSPRIFGSRLRHHYSHCQSFPEHYPWDINNSDVTRSILRASRRSNISNRTQLNHSNNISMLSGTCEHSADEISSNQIVEPFNRSSQQSTNNDSLISYDINPNSNSNDVSLLNQAENIDTSMIFTENQLNELNKFENSCVNECSEN